MGLNFAPISTEGAVGDLERQMPNHYAIYMQRLSPTFIVAIMITILLSCTASKSTASKEACEQRLNMAIIAWNEDSINSFAFALNNDNKFTWTIVNKDSSAETTEIYYGTCKETSDTLYLHYGENLQPAGMTQYLVKEISGKYLIQFFVTDKKAIFLRLQTPGNRFRY